MRYSRAAMICAGQPKLVDLTYDAIFVRDKSCGRPPGEGPAAADPVGRRGAIAGLRTNVLSVLKQYQTATKVAC
jgi:hypothetical protein